MQRQLPGADAKNGWNVSRYFIIRHSDQKNKGGLKNSAAYIQNWTNAIKGDSKLIVHASSKAQKAYDLIMNIQGEK